MKHKIVFVPINALICHERVNRARLRKMREILSVDGTVKRPVIVDRTSQMILDGHHRVQALRDLGASRVPVAYVRYQDQRVRVYLRRKNLLMKLIKQFVLEAAKSRTLFPSKTTRHVIAARPTMKAVRLADLMT